MRLAILVEAQFAVTIWRLTTMCGIGKLSGSCIVVELCNVIATNLLHQYVSIRTGD